MKRAISATLLGTNEVHHDEYSRRKILTNKGLRKRGFEHARHAKSPGNLKKFRGANRLKRMKTRMQVQNRYTDPRLGRQALVLESPRRWAVKGIFNGLYLTVDMAVTYQVARSLRVLTVANASPSDIHPRASIFPGGTVF
jgi:hypothetical protein